MNQILRRILLTTFFTAGTLTASEAPESIVWNLTSTDSVGGASIIIKGEPKVVDSELDSAVEFSGPPDQLLVCDNPIGSATAWTIEVIIKPYSIGNTTVDIDQPRFLHLQDSTDDSKRITMEMRVADDDTWYFDGFIKSPGDNLTLIESNLTHPVDKWYNCAITYGNGTFTTYINGTEELSGSVIYDPVSGSGVTSLGCRMNLKNYFKGAIKKVIFTRAVLTPDQFDQSYKGTAVEHRQRRIQPTATRPSANTATLQLHLLPAITRGFTLSGRSLPGGRQYPALSGGIIVREANTTRN